MRRASSLLGFAALGVFWGAWDAALPALQRKTGADDGELGLALVLVGLGALVSMRAVGVLLDRARGDLTALTVGAFGLAGLLPALAGSPAELYVIGVVLGATSGAMDVAINADAVREEVRSGRPLLNLSHAAFSLGVVGSSLATGALRSQGAGVGSVFVLVAALVVAAAVAIWLARDGERDRAGEPPRLFARLPPWLLLVGALGAGAYWVENAWQNWGAVHLERSLEAGAGTSALAPALFAAAMAAGRLAVHRLAGPGTERVVLVAGATFAGLGSIVAALAGTTVVALAGLLVAGLGCAVCAPTLVSLAGRAAAPAERATIVGSITTLMYLGFIVGPAVVGAAAELTTLRASLGGVAGLALLLAILFAFVPLPGPRSSR